jgi:predicted nucleotidyltransferase
MRPSELLEVQRETIRQLLLDSGMVNPRVFGSVLHGDDSAESDLDLLVDPAPRTSLLTMVKLQTQLEQATGIKIDLHTPGELHTRVRAKVLSEAKTL